MGRCKFYVSPSRRVKNAKRLISHMKTRILILEQILCNKNEQSDMFIEQSDVLIPPKIERPSVFPSNSVSSFPFEESFEQTGSLPISPLKPSNENSLHLFCEEDSSFKYDEKSQSYKENESFTHTFNSALFKMMEDKFEKHTLELKHIIQNEIT